MPLTGSACKKATWSPPAVESSFSGKGFVFQEDFEPVAADWVYHNTDTVATTVVKMIALDSSAIAYTWTIGSAIYNTKEVRLNFPPDYLRLNKQLYVKLTMRYKTTTHTDSVQTFVRQLTFFNPCESKLNGVFKGSTDDAPQTDSFEILTCTHDVLHPDISFYLSNFRQG